jgi:ATP-dependent exoDNAse (exonuclease V) beta subunit
VTVLIDQAERDRFTSTRGKNISVIAPAGVGKTHAIVRRIVTVASQPEAFAIDQLSRLIVVTYSVRAAQQMQQRAREAIRQAGLPRSVQRAFQQTFFGTIHSFCVRLLDRFGHYLGLPSPVGLLQDHDEWWNRFLLHGLSAESESFADLFHFYTPEKLYSLGKEISPGPVESPGPMPELNLKPLIHFPLEGLHHATKRSLAGAQASVVRWQEAWARGDRFYPLPKCPQTSAAAFVETWAATFAPLHEWLRHAALAFGREVANAYAKFRLSEAVMTYDDQVRIARRLLDLPAVQRELADDRYSVLLDEAQDTDPGQFEVLRRVAGLGGETGQGENQSFSIVGDFQQAIYAPRSDLAVYRRVHDELIAEPRGAVSKLEVTFRCDHAVIDFVNKIFPSLLHGEEGQSPFSRLRAREDAGAGQVARWHCPDEPGHAAGGKINAEERARHEAHFLAGQLKRLGPAGIGATSWSQVAILCPRRNWLLQIAGALQAAEVPCQLHSADEMQSDRTPGTWLSALIWVVAHPEDTFEIAGVLREIFGVADSDMAHFTRGEGDRLRLDRATTGNEGPLSSALKVLRELVARAAELPVHLLVQEILEKTRLRDRLRSLRDFEMEDADSDLDEFLAAIYQRGAEGAMLSELAEELRVGLEQPSAAEEEIRDAVQLLTSHKAKGLEWQTVILPYVFRSIESKKTAYPRLVQGDGGHEMIYRDKDDYAAHAKDRVQIRDRQQLERLLYVMCTRARHTLLLIDDKTLFEGQTRRSGWSAAELLKILEGVNRVTWEALPNALTISESPVKIVEEAELPTPGLPSFSRAKLKSALKHATDFTRRITPHALAVPGAAESEPEVTSEREENQQRAPDNPGILYGTWWHEFMQTVPWDKPRLAWQKRFDRAFALSPQRERSEREWELFLKSGLAQMLAEKSSIVQREWPFLLLEENQNCVEGVIDLAVYSARDSSWQVIDWKTNRVVGGESAALVDIYRGQIAAYVRALRKLLSAEVRSSLYITQTGEWLPIE